MPESEDDPLVLAKLLKNFKDIPADVELDIFGEIYEYFLDEFALAEGRGGGEFFTPAPVVRYMVEVLAPTEGKVLDPACGSSGMFVQTAHDIEKHKARGKQMNLRAYGAELEQVKDRPRFNAYGVLQNKTKNKKKDARETVPNGNYLWNNQFATALNDTGRAALVMANSASDAGNSEKDIRVKLIESGIISQMVTLPSNMFTSVTLPATLWFFDKAKVKKDEILFIDARNIFTQIDRAHRKFSDGQIRNLGIITRLYEGKADDFGALLADYCTKLVEAPEVSDDEDIMHKSYWQSNIDWLTERFPEGKYRDVLGLCKVAKIGKIFDDKGKFISYEDDSIGDQDFSLNPGRYVGVVNENDGLTQGEFKHRMMAYYTSLSKLNEEAHSLENKIAANLQELFQ